MKFGLPLAALFGIGFFASATLLESSDDVSVAAGPATLTDGRIVMANPKLEGFTSDKRPYKMVADRAVQESAKSSVVELQKISADLPFGDAVTAKVTADTGMLDNAANRLDLKDNIKLLTSDGMVAHLASARIDIANNEMSTDKAVDITTNGSHITADSMKIAKGGKTIIFETRVRVKIDAGKLKNAAAE